MNLKGSSNRDRPNFPDPSTTPPGPVDMDKEADRIQQQALANLRRAAERAKQERLAREAAKPPTR